MLPVGADSPEWPRLVKTFGKGIMNEQTRRSNDDGMSLAMQPRSKLNSPNLHPQIVGRTNLAFSKCEHSKSINFGHAMHHSSRFSQGTSFVDKSSSSMYRDFNAGTVLISPAAADEGSRTGIKGSGVLKIINSNIMDMDRSATATAMLPTTSRPWVIPQIAEPDPSNMSSCHGLASAGRQMTIFYAGRAHVFDDVHPNKADVIMALAGSNGGSWSTSYSPKSSAAPPSTDNRAPSREKLMVFSNSSFSRDLNSRLSFRLQSPSQLSKPPSISHLPNLTPGAHQDAGDVARDARPTALGE